MTFSDIIQSVKQHPLQKLRADTQDRFEVVVPTDQIKALSSTLEQFFGSAKKPAGAKASGEIADLVSDFGGILRNQTLYYVATDGFSNIAMIWPWSDGKNATIKIFRLSYKNV